MSREWYPWYPDRFWGSAKVARLDDAAVALYKFLLDHEYKNGPFEDDTVVLGVICARFRSFKKSWPQVRKCFQVDDAGLLFNPLAEENRRLEREASDSRAERSKNSWLKRRAESEHRLENARGEHVHSKRTARAKQPQSAPNATDGRTDGRTNVRTDGRTDGGAGGPAPGASPSAPPARKRALVVLDPGSILGEFPALNTPEVLSAAEAYIAARKGKHGAWTPQGMRIALRKLNGATAADAVAAFEASTEGPWQTVWPRGVQPVRGRADSSATAAIRGILQRQGGAA